MLDIHAPHEAVHTWTDFFIHIATICVGLLIAIGLEQSVEVIHHHHQREDLEHQMHVESGTNLKLVQSQLAFEQLFLQYLNACTDALEAASYQAGAYTVTLPVNHVQLPLDSNGMLISPSRGTWTVATASGAIALLSAETAKIYARLDLSEAFEQEAERDSGHDGNVLAIARARDNALQEGVPLHLSSAQRDDLLSAYTGMRLDASIFAFRLAIVEGALQAILANVHSLEEMYPYQGRAIAQAKAHGPSIPVQLPATHTPATQ
jgi:hypothetical protein